MGNNIVKEQQPKCNGTGKEESISFETFGEATSLPLDIRKAVFEIADPTPFLRRFLASLELTVVNNVVKHKAISGKLRVSLPVGATVKKFEVLSTTEQNNDNVWYPATAVPKRKAKEVIYKEKEKGRNVAAVSNVASGSNIFEIDVSPLPFEREVKCRLECLMVGNVAEFQHLLEEYFPKEKSRNIEVISFLSRNRSLSNHREMKGGVEDDGGAAVGDCFGKTHFVCRVPALIQDEMHFRRERNIYTSNKIQHIAVVWDTSASMSESSEDDKLVVLNKRCDRLRELAAKCNIYQDLQDELPVTFELHNFGIGAPVKVGIFDDVEKLLNAVSTIDYDGGTDVTSLSALFLDMARQNRSGEDTQECPGKNNEKPRDIDTVLVFTDGIDSFGRLPNLEGLVSLPFPVHVVADGKEVNLRCLRAITSSSPQYPGRIFTQKDESYLHGVLFPDCVLKSIKTDQSMEAFMEETDDGFRCVPDHRLLSLNQPIGPEGLLISGILGKNLEQNGETDAVSNIIANVAFGAELHEFCFQLGQDSSPLNGNREIKTVQGEKVKYHHYQAINLSARTEMDLEIVDSIDGIKMDFEVLHPAASSLSSMIDSARILGHIYAENVYLEAESFGIISGMDVDGIREDLSIQYGFCSPESSLLMLYTMEQFLENQVLPPIGHPAYNDERAINARNRRFKEKKQSKLASGEDYNTQNIILGEIGGPKTDKEKGDVLELAKRLKEYFGRAHSARAVKGSGTSAEDRKTRAKNTEPLPTGQSNRKAKKESKKKSKKKVDSTVKSVKAVTGSVTKTAVGRTKPSDAKAIATRPKTSAKSKQKRCTHHHSASMVKPQVERGVTSLPSVSKTANVDEMLQGTVPHKQKGLNDSPYWPHSTTTNPDINERLSPLSLTKLTEVLIPKKISHKQKGFEDALDWLHSNDASPDIADVPIPLPLPKLTGVPTSRQEVKQKNKRVSKKQKEWEDALDWLRNNDASPYIVDEPILLPLAKLTGRPMSMRETKPKNKKKVPESAPDALDWLRSNDASPDLVEEPILLPLAKLTGVPMPMRLTKAEKKKEVVDDALDWLRSNDPIPDTVDEPTLEAFAGIAGVPIPRQLPNPTGINTPCDTIPHEDSSRGQVRKSSSKMHTDTSPIAPPVDPKVYAQKIEEALSENGIDDDSDGNLWKKEYQAQRNTLSALGHKVSPSFFLTCARLALKHGHVVDAIKIASNCLEMNIEDVQMLRCVGYFFLSTHDDDGIDLAVEAFNKVQELQPCEPQSFLDGALVRFWKIVTCTKKLSIMEDKALDEMKADVLNAQKLLSRVLTNQWATRFKEIEWPALILLHCIADAVKEINQTLTVRSEDRGALPEWPDSDDLGSFFGDPNAAESTTSLLRCHNFDLALMVWMGWDSDNTDLDLHIVEPTGNEIYYCNKSSDVGGCLSRDFTRGYGPEVYLLKDRPERRRKKGKMVGKYDIYAKYYASHQDSKLTGTTSAVLWTIEKNGGGEKKITFQTVRLDTKKQKSKVGTVRVCKS